MKKSTFVLCALLCAGLAPKSSHAQTAETPPTAQEAQKVSYASMLSESKREFAAGNYESSARIADGALGVAASTEETGNALTLLAESFYRRKMYAEAEAQWAKLLALPDDDDDDLPQIFANVGLARSYSAQNRWAEAIPELQTVIESFAATEDDDDDETEGKVDPKDGDEDAKDDVAKLFLMPFQLALADAYYHTEQYDLAMEQLEKVIALDLDQELYTIRTVMLVKAGEIDLLQRNLDKSRDEFNQILAMKEIDGTSTQKFAQLKIRTLDSLAANGLGKGQVNEHIIFSIIPTTEMDEEMSESIAVIADTFAYGLINSFGE